MTTDDRALLVRWTAGGNLLVVTHGANIQALTGVSLVSGDMVVVKGGSVCAEPVGRVLLD